MKAIVFGELGFVGRKVVSQLRQEDVEVVEIYGPRRQMKLR
jgi:nucleoside-diphosphate-sugar epimerase